MKKGHVRKTLVILTLGLFFIGTTQITLSFSGNNRDHSIRTAETNTTFDPFMEGWMYRRQISINHTNIAGNLPHFPVLLSIIDPNLRAKAQNDGDDILFMNGMGTASQLNHEIERYDGTTGELMAWVTLPQLSSTADTIFYMYYGNQNSTNQQHPLETWDSSYLAVWHMNDANPTTILDSTSSSNTGNKIAPDEPNEVDGKVGKGQNFDGSDDFIQFNDSIIPLGTKTISGWIKRHTWDTWGVVYATSTGISSLDKGTAWTMIPSNHTMECYLGNELWGSHFMKVYVQIPDVTFWHYYTMTYDETTLRVYIDGILNNFTIETMGNEAIPEYNLRIGETNHPSFDYPLDAELDEFRIANTVLSPEWIATEYANQNTPYSFLTIGPEEKIPLKTTIMVGKISNVISQGEYLKFEAIKLHCIQFSPFSFTTYSSNDFVLVSNQYRGFIKTKMALAICQAYL